MAGVLTAAALLVLCGSAASLLLFVSLLDWAATLPPQRAALRARLSLAALFLPPLLSVLATAYALARQYLHPLYSPHAEYVRPHLCLRPLLSGPDAGWRAQVFAGLCLLLILTAVVVLLVRLSRGARDSARLRSLGAASAPSGAVEVVPSTSVAVASHLGPGRLVAVNPRLDALFPGELGRAILAHEICHARRRDSLSQALAQSALALQALSPAAYLEYAWWREERELACDLEAAEATSPAAMTAALARAEELAQAVGEVSPLATPDARTLRALALRRERLREAQSAPSSPGWQTGPVVTVVAVVVLVVLGVLLRRQLGDSLQCLAESFLQVL